MKEDPDSEKFLQSVYGEIPSKDVTAIFRGCCSFQRNRMDRVFHFRREEDLVKIRRKVTSDRSCKHECK